jgi:hypothetical protein
MTPTDPYDDHWHQLVTAALLGTDRRDPPAPPPGPLADLVADTVRETPSQRMLADVAASAAVRRGAFVAGPPATRLVAAPVIDRPSCPVEAVATWRYLAAEWPVLEDEWVLAAFEHRWQLPPDVVVALLGTHRDDPVRRARVALAAGPLAGWLTEHVPGLAAGGPAGRRGAVDAEQVTTLPHLPIPPELAELTRVDAHTFCRRLLAEVDAGRMGRAERAVLVNLLARCRPEVLEPAAVALAEVDAGSPSAAEAWALADLATTRRRMLDELARPAGTPSR